MVRRRSPGPPAEPASEAAPDSAFLTVEACFRQGLACLEVQDLAGAERAYRAAADL